MQKARNTVIAAIIAIAIVVLMLWVFLVLLRPDFGRRASAGVIATGMPPYSVLSLPAVNSNAFEAQTAKPSA
jgi:cell division protein FtsW (lipid II flippase)